MVRSDKGRGTKVYIGTRSRAQPTQQEKALLSETITQKCQIFLFNLVIAASGFIAYTASDRDTEKLYEYKSMSIINKNKNINFRLSPEQKAQRTVLAKRIDKDLFKHSADDLKRDLNANLKERKLKVEVVFVHKVETHGFIKLQFRSAFEAETAQKNGLFCFGRSLPKFCLQRERFVHVRQCMKCYKFNHSTYQCKNTQRICSTCGQTGHIYKGCKVDPHCLNCKGPHKATAGACAERKKRVKEAGGKPSTSTATRAERIPALRLTDGAVSSPSPRPSTPRPLLSPLSPDSNTGPRTFAQATARTEVRAQQTAGENNILSQSTGGSMVVDSIVCLALQLPYFNGITGADSYRQAVQKTLNANGINWLKVPTLDDNLLEERLRGVKDKLGPCDQAGHNGQQVHKQGKSKKKKKAQTGSQKRRKAQKRKMAQPVTQTGKKRKLSQIEEELTVTNESPRVNSEELDTEIQGTTVAQVHRTPSPDDVQTPTSTLPNVEVEEVIQDASLHELLSELLEEEGNIQDTPSQPNEAVELEESRSLEDEETEGFDECPKSLMELVRNNVGPERDTLTTVSPTRGPNLFDRPMTREARKNLKGEIKITRPGFTCFIPHKPAIDLETLEDSEELFSMYVTSMTAFNNHVENWNHNDLKAGLLAQRKTLSIVPLSPGNTVEMLMKRILTDKVDLSQRVMYVSQRINHNK